MQNRFDYSYLCCLIDDSLHPYTALEGNFLTKEKEKALLIALSQVFREVEVLKHKLDSDSEDTVAIAPTCYSNSSGTLTIHSEDHPCLEKIVSDLIVFLASESQYVQHLAGNILVATSKLVGTSGRNWNEFLHLLCVCLEVAAYHTLSYSSKPSKTGSEDLIRDLSSSFILLRPRLKHSSLSTVAGLARIFRNILKYLKQENDDQLVRVYFDCVGSCLNSIPWDLLNEIGQPVSKIVFSGNIVQLFCSMVEKCGGEATSDSVNNHPILLKINDLVPKLLYWCLDKQNFCSEMCLSQYFKHKTLMLMIRLSSKLHLDSSILVSWLLLLQKHFQDLLQQPIGEPGWLLNEFEDGSPFLASLLDKEEHNICSHHLQRRAIFLFMKCSLSLTSSREENGLLKLHEWLQCQLPGALFVEQDLYWENCMNFALSFIQLFVHEDDILFEVLLLLLNLPVHADQQICEETGTFLPMEEDKILFHISNVFNPIHLFHLFLAELHYDHQVLLDYLISRDTGINCAAYLLKCLRLVCKSWDLFVGFSPSGNSQEQSRKKIKILQDDPNSLARSPAAPVERTPVPLLLEMGCKLDDKYGHKHHRTDVKTFEEAKDCLISLKTSVERLYKKNLFPYNPGVLLKRLTRFQELCIMQEESI